jgi:hypothetical protein
MRNPRLVLAFFRQFFDGSSLARCLIWQASFFLPPDIVRATRPNGWPS